MAEPLAEICVVLLPDGQIRIGSTCAGAPDSSYAPLADERASGEVGRLIGELRARLSEGGELIDLRMARLQAQAKVLACEVAIAESTPGALGSFGLLRLRARACLASLHASRAAQWVDPERERQANAARVNASVQPEKAASVEPIEAVPHISVSHDLQTGEPTNLFFFAKPGRPAISVELEPGEGALVAQMLRSMSADEMARSARVAADFRSLEVTRSGVTETASSVTAGEASSDLATNQQRCPMGATDIDKTMHAFVLRQAVNAAVDKVREGPERDPIKAAEQVVAAYTAATRLLQQGQSA